MGRFIYAGSGTTWNNQIISNLVLNTEVQPHLSASLGCSIDFARRTSNIPYYIIAVGDIGQKSTNFKGAVGIFSSNWGAHQGSAPIQYREIIYGENDFDLFGTSVSFNNDGSLLFVGAPGRNNNNDSSWASVVLLV